MTPSFWNGQVHDFGFEKPTEAGSVRARHHARLWKTNFMTADGRRVYVGTASLDTGLKWVITHQIEPDVDTERATVVEDLTKAQVVEQARLEQFVKPTLGTNFSGDQFFTDGKIYLVELK